MKRLLMLLAVGLCASASAAPPQSTTPEADSYWGSQLGEFLAESELHRVSAKAFQQSLQINELAVEKQAGNRFLVLSGQVMSVSVNQGGAVVIRFVAPPGEIEPGAILVRNPEQKSSAARLGRGSAVTLLCGNWKYVDASFAAFDCLMLEPANQKKIPRKLLDAMYKKK